MTALAAIERFAHGIDSVVKLGTTDPAWLYEPVNPHFESICIGARSHFDRCYICPLTGRDRRFPARAASTEQVSTLLERAIAVSVERPFVGGIDGPFVVFAPYAEMSYGTTPQRVRPPVLLDYWGSDNLALGEVLHPRLHLDFHRICPPFLPTKRAPFEYAFSYPQFGTSGLAVGSVRLPAYGRTRYSVSLEGAGITAGGGDVQWSLVGQNMTEVGNAGGTKPNNHSHTLQGTTTENADFDRTYFFDGEFDMVLLSLIENTGLAAGTTLSGLIKMWD